jgi:RNA polymerase sigma factor (sigma-70 family)
MALDLPNNEILISRARKGDLEALEGLYRAYEVPVYTMARRLCRRPEDAEEVVQETFMEMVGKIGGFRGEAPFLHWIRRIAANKAISRIRKLSVRGSERPLEGDWEAEALGDSPELFSAGQAEPHQAMDLERALSKLSDTARSVLWLHDVEGYTHEEIAAMMSRTQSFSKSQLSRAHERLRALLGGEKETEECTRA